MSVDATVRHALGYAGGTLRLADEHTLVFASGHALRFTSTVSFAQSFLVRSRPRALTAFDCHAASHTLAVAVREPRAAIALYSLPDRKPRGRLVPPSPSTSPSSSDGAAFEYSLLSFSHCGRRLLSLSPLLGGSKAEGDDAALGPTGPPRLALCVWDVEQLAPVAGCERGEVAMVGSVLFASFDPSDADQIVVGGAGGLQVWKVYRSQAGDTHGALLRTKTVDMAELDGDRAAERSHALCHAWTPQGRVLVGTAAGDVLVVDAGSARVERRIALACRGSAVAGLVATTETLVVLYADGGVAWLSASGDELQQTAALPVDDDGPADEQPDGRGVVAALAVTPSFARAFVATTRGQILELRTTVPQDDEDDDALESAAATGAGEAAGHGEATAVDAASLLVAPWASFPSGPVCACAPLTPFGGTPDAGDALLATGGPSGVLALWSLASGRLVAQTRLAALFSSPASTVDGQPPPQSPSASPASSLPPVVITSLAARLQDPVLLAGDAAGRLRALCVAKALNPNAAGSSSSTDATPLELLPLHSAPLLDAPLDVLALHATQPVALAASTRLGAVVLVSLDHETRFAPTAILTLEGPNETIVDAQWTAPPHSPTALIVTCFSSLGHVYVARHQPDAAPSPFAVPATLRAKLVAFGDHVVDRCAALRFLSSAPMSLMLAASPASADVALLQYPDVVVDARERIALAVRALARDAHEGGVAQLAVLQHALPNGAGELVATAGADGVLALWLVTCGGGSSGSSGSSEWRLAEVQAAKKRALVAHAGAVTSLQFVAVGGGSNGLALVSTGADGLVFVLDVRLALALQEPHEPPRMSALYLNVAAFAKYEAGFRPEADEPNGTEAQPSLLAALADREAARARERPDERRLDTRARLRELARKLQALLAENAALPERERLARDELVLHTEWRDARLREHRARADRVRALVERELARMRIVRERMRREFWDAAAEPGVQLGSLFPAAGASGASGAAGAAGAAPMVLNFPMRRLERGEQRRAAQIELLRLTEREHHRQEAAQLEDAARARLQRSVPAELAWLVDAGALHPARWLSPDGAADNAADLNAVTSAQLVYHPAELRSPRQLRAQVLLLKGAVRGLAAQFNAELAQAAALKRARADEVEARQARMREILTELQGSSGAGAAAPEVEAAVGPRPGWAPAETAAALLELGEHEMTQRPYETEAARAQREAAAQRALALEAQRLKDDVGGRALRDMMGGTLEAKRDPLLGAASAALLVPAEPWMLELAPEDMTAEQRALVAAREQALARLRDEQDKYRKGLDLELKKLRLEVAELARGFDDKLRALRSRYAAARRRTLAQQLYELRLVAELLRRETLVEARRKALADVAERELLVRSAERDAAEAQAASDRCKEDWHRSVEEDKALERGFARELEESAGVGGGPFDHELLRQLHELFRRRRTTADESGGGGSHNPSRPRLTPSATAKQRLLGDAVGGGSGASTRALAAASVLQSLQHAATRGSGDDEPSLDPFRHVDAAAQASKGSAQAAVAPLDYDTDRPDGLLVEDRVWRALNALRTRKVLAEGVVRDRAEALARAKAVSDELRQTLADRQRALEGARTAQHRVANELAALDTSAPLLVAIKQGQDETQPNTELCIDGDDGENGQEALLVARAQVEALNAVLQLHGREQVGVLTRIKDFRKSINVMEWEHALLELQARDVDARYTDLQLLRVTKELQELFQHGGDATRRHRREAALLEAKLAHLAQHRVAERGKADARLAALRSQLRERERENRGLQERLAALETQVQIRQDICASRSHLTSGGGGAAAGGDHASRLQAISVRRKLVDLARAQTGEIEFLRLELDRMRRRTFPSFAHLEARADAVD